MAKLSKSTVIQALENLGGEDYGVPIHVEVERLLNERFVSIGAVYSTLDRMEMDGLVTSRMEEGTPERGWKSKKYFKLIKRS